MPPAQDGSRRLETTLSVNMNRRVLTLFRAGAMESDKIEDSNAMELGFQEKYGSVLWHTWFGDGYLLIAFANGYLVIMSTHNKEARRAGGPTLVCRRGASPLVLPPPLRRLPPLTRSRSSLPL